MCMDFINSLKNVIVKGIRNSVRLYLRKYIVYVYETMNSNKVKNNKYGSKDLVYKIMYAPIKYCV